MIAQTSDLLLLPITLYPKGKAALLAAVFIIGVSLIIYAYKHVSNSNGEMY